MLYLFFGSLVFAVMFFGARGGAAVCSGLLLTV